MIISQVLAVLTETGLSPEEFGEVVGVSGMTLRRWLKKPKQAAIPRVYVPAIREACYQLISQGRLQAASPSVRTILSEAPSSEYRAALQNLGLRQGSEIDKTASQNQILVVLSQIGSQTKKQADVEENRKKVFSFKKLGDEWSKRITTLWEIIRSKKLSPLDKLVAYGALFYLLTPIDFIPDNIPFFGLLDDFGVLGIAVTYYTTRFGEVL